MNHKKYISVRDVSFSFSQEGKPFFENMAIDFKVGQINFVCGKNGMGKSTLLKILSGKASSHVQGTFHFEGKNYALQNLQDQFDGIAMVSQNFNEMLVETYSFDENLQFALLSKYPSLKKLSKTLPLPCFVEKYGINSDIPIQMLSGGQRQILSILMVLQRCPKILLLDEPTAALDEENSNLVMTFLQELCIQESITIIAIVHDFELVKKYSQVVYFELYQEHRIRKVRIIAV
ncbi:ATP-binding cassette domain-containing protein [Candidatus Babeliales bacterium]|nr:ATP-binding cassette domain-containing protein [Candidatus Babeliales bacterium]MBP9844328.1 ATP-binding cassette domain-containing protein [Candidatus Babeliales bacterium]